MKNDKYGEQASKLIVKGFRDLSLIRAALHCCQGDVDMAEIYYKDKKDEEAEYYFRHHYLNNGISAPSLPDIW